MPRVCITATEQVSYHKVMDISDEAMAEYNAAVSADEDDTWFSQWADRYLDPLNDVSGGGEYEDVEVTICPDKGGAE